MMLRKAPLLLLGMPLTSISILSASSRVVRIVAGDIADVVMPSFCSSSLHATWITLSAAALKAS